MPASHDERAIRRNGCLRRHRGDLGFRADSDPADGVPHGVADIWDDDNNLTQDTRGHILNYNGRDQLTSDIDPTTGDTTTYEWDPRGTLHTTTQADGSTVVRR